MHAAQWYCSYCFKARLVGPPHKALYTVALQGVALKGGMAAAVRWWESPYHSVVLNSQVGMAVRSACFPAADTLGQ
jgi:hypothetical protein